MQLYNINIFIIENKFRHENNYPYSKPRGREPLEGLKEKGKTLKFPEIATPKHSIATLRSEH